MNSVYFIKYPLASVFSVIISVFLSIFVIALAPAIYSSLQNDWFPRQLLLSSQVSENSSQTPLSQKLGDSLSSLSWFVHVSDLHLSYTDPARTRRLEHFCDSILPAIRPHAIACTGDLVHGHLTSGESHHVLKEWQDYRRVLESRHLFDPKIWLDVRGNHDARNLMRLPSHLKDNQARLQNITSSRYQPSLLRFRPLSALLFPHRAHPTPAAEIVSPDVDPFLSYSVSGSHGSANSYQHILKTSDSAYRLIMLDQTPRPGPHRFFNFFGFLDPDHLTNAVDSDDAFPLSNSVSPVSSQPIGGTVVAGHYPLFLVDHFSRCQISSHVSSVSSIMVTNSSKLYSKFVAVRFELLSLWDLFNAVLFGWSRIQCSLNNKGAFEDSNLLKRKYISDDSIAYLSGHFHDGLGDQLHSHHTNGSLELETIDFKNRAAFRIVALDAGILSFVDSNSKSKIHDDDSSLETVPVKWPLILVTNPKPAAYLTSSEPWHRILLSTHVRTLVFHQSPHAWVTKMHVKIDDVDLPPAQQGNCQPESNWWSEARGNWPLLTSNQECPLFVTPWNPQALSPGVHDIHVEVAVMDQNGEVSTHFHSHKFSVDGTRTRMPGSNLIRFLLHVDFAKFLPICCLIGWLGLLLVFTLIPRYLTSFASHELAESGYCSKLESIFSSYIKYSKETMSDSLQFFFILAILMYLPIGPWMWATFISERPALMFVWGLVFLDGSGVVLFLQQDVLFYVFRRLVLGVLPCIIFLIVCSVIQHKLQSRKHSPLATVAQSFISFWLPCFILVSALLLFAKFELAGVPLLTSMFTWRYLAFSPGGFWLSLIMLTLMSRRLIKLLRVLFVVSQASFIKDRKI